MNDEIFIINGKIKGRNWLNKEKPCWQYCIDIQLHSQVMVGYRKAKRINSPYGPENER
ncbi:hypothetical protein B14911_02384 [Bacillus sp. NRRL B-14911]|nr:hypothetical protein B14911_02384 [Bacillus sp. NRRL B-14911]